MQASGNRVFREMDCFGTKVGPSRIGQGGKSTIYSFQEASWLEALMEGSRQGDTLTRPLGRKISDIQNRKQEAESLLGSSSYMKICLTNFRVTSAEVHSIEKQAHIAE